MDSLTISTCMAPNMDYFCGDLAGYLSRRLSLPTRVRLDIPWQDRERLLDEGEIDLCWICGLPYAWKADRTPGRIEPLAAPVMQGSRYQSRPIYFSDVVVRRDSPFQALAELGGAAWAYNESGSHSGYNAVRYSLARQGKTLAFFGRVIEAGAHQVSLQMILRGEIDASAIDSTVLEQELRDDPAIGAKIRVIDTFGPSPIPPWVVASHLSSDIKNELLQLFTQMDQFFSP